MANIKDLKKKIRSTKSTHKITTAMKLVSAAKLAKAQANIQNSRPYAVELEKTIKEIAALVDGYSHNFLEESDNPHNALLVISSNRGLCGGYNTQLFKAVNAFLEKNGKDNFKVHFVGKKVKELLKDTVNAGKHFTFERLEPTHADMKAVANELGELFQGGEYGKVYVAYNRFKSAINFSSEVNQILPLTLSTEEKEEIRKKCPFDFSYDQSPKSILDDLIPETFVNTIYTHYLDAVASEHGSRMSAMENATKNCSEMIRTLTLKMNKLRQAAITNELIEVVSGAEALNG